METEHAHTNEEDALAEALRMLEEGASVDDVLGGDSPHADALQEMLPVMDMLSRMGKSLAPGEGKLKEAILKIKADERGSAHADVSVKSPYAKYVWKIGVPACALALVLAFGAYHVKQAALSPTVAMSGDSSDASLDADVQKIDTDMAALEQDGAAVDTSLNDQPVQQAQ